MVKSLAPSPALAPFLVAASLASAVPEATTGPRAAEEARDVSSTATEPIRDNSFLIEEAYNQRAGEVQHISSFVRERGTGAWLYTFTQEWPAPTVRHQVSWTLLFVRPGDDGSEGWGDVGINYRWQAIGAGGGPVAFAPRASLFFPTGSSDEGRGNGGPAMQINLPLSLEIGPRLVSHTNLGALHVWDARNDDGESADLDAVWAGQSVIWILHPRFNPMLELLWTHSESVAGDGITEDRTSFLISPGARFAFDRPSGLQIVPGIAFPFETHRGESDGGVFLYLSFEHPF